MMPVDPIQMDIAFDYFLDKWYSDDDRLHFRYFRLGVVIAISIYFTADCLDPNQDVNSSPPASSRTSVHAPSIPFHFHCRLDLLAFESSSSILLYPLNPKPYRLIHFCTSSISLDVNPVAPSIADAFLWSSRRNWSRLKVNKSVGPECPPPPPLFIGHSVSWTCWPNMYCRGMQANLIYTTW